MTRAPILAVLVLAGCATPKPAIEIRTVEVPVVEQRPCPVQIPKRPDPLARPLPSDANELARLLAAKLDEWAGAGGYGEQAEAALKRCVAP